MKKKIIIIIGVIIVFVIVGIILYNTVLKDIPKDIYEIRFTNLDVVDGSVPAIEPCSISETDTKISFKVELNEQEDSYECGLFIRNYGNMEGTIKKIETSTYNEDILDYTIQYEDGSLVQVGDKLSVDTAKYVTFKVKFKENKNTTTTADITTTIDYEY